jgi:hypothetical protein
MLKFMEVFSMLKGILILILIAILVAIGASVALQVIFWSMRVLFRVAFNLVIVVAAFMGIMFLIRKLRAG